MHDRDVRRALLAQLLSTPPASDEERLIRGELGLMHGDVRVDVAVLTRGLLHGYEIKSERDNLKRLPRQVEAYSAVLDRCTLVVAAKHLQHALPLLPSWWGVTVARAQESEAGDSAVALEQLREAQGNPDQQPLALARLLWRTEVLQLLKAWGAAKGFWSASLYVLYRRLLEVVPPSLLAVEVRRILVGPRTTRQGERW